MLKKRILCILISLMLILGNCAALAIQYSIEQTSMITTIKQLIAYPRGYKNKEIEYAKQFVINTFTKYDLDVKEQLFETSLVDENGDKYTGTNIIGTLHPNSKTNTKDILIIGAHYDGVSDFPAANDNASGIAVMLEMARILHTLESDTEIRFVAFDAEEAGLLGSDYYANSITDEAGNIIGMLNFDMLAAKKSDGVHIYSGDKIDNYLYDILKSDSDFSGVQIDRNTVFEDDTIVATSDYVSFISKLIPTLSFSNIPVVEEMHNENDTISNIDPNMLEYAANAGLTIATEIMSASTPSYIDKIEHTDDNTVYNVPTQIKFPFDVNRDEFAKELGIKLTQKVSATTQIQYKANVQLFDMEQAVTLIVEENPFMAASFENVVTDCIIDATGISFNEFYQILNKNFGQPLYTQNQQRETYVWSDKVYGNQYIITLEDDDVYQMHICEYIGEQEAYLIENNNLTRLVNSSVNNDHLVIDKSNEGYSVQITPPATSKTLSVTMEAHDTWNKLKSVLSDEQLSKIRYIYLNTNGIGSGDAIIITSAIPKQEIIDKYILRMNSNQLDHFETDTLMNGSWMYIDYMDLLDSRGVCYSSNELKKEIAIAYAKDTNGENSPSAWALADIISAIKDEVLPLDLAQNYTQDISRLDFCKIAYELFKPTINSPKPTIIFDDSTDAAVISLASLGIIYGKDNNLFMPNDFITREEAATIMARISNYFTLSHFSDDIRKYDDDTLVSKWAKNSVYEMRACKIMEGMDHNCFAPQAHLTKEQSIATLMRLYNKLNE